MITVLHEGLSLHIMQQGEVLREGEYRMQGSLQVNEAQGCATFVEHVTGETVRRNPVCWKGKHVTLRFNKSGKMRGTFFIEPSVSRRQFQDMEQELTDDLASLFEFLEELWVSRHRRTSA